MHCEFRIMDPTISLLIPTKQAIRILPKTHLIEHEYNRHITVYYYTLLTQNKAKLYDILYNARLEIAHFFPHIYSISWLTSGNHTEFFNTVI